MKQKWDNLSVKVAMAKSVCDMFLTKLKILQKLILHLNLCKHGLWCPTDTHNSSMGSLKCLFFRKLNKNLKIWV